MLEKHGYDSALSKYLKNNRAQEVKEELPLLSL